MSANLGRQNRQGDVLSLLNAVLAVSAVTERVKLVNELSNPTPAKALFGSIAVILSKIRVSFVLSSSDLFQPYMWLGRQG